MRIAWFVVGIAATVCGIAGIFLPLLPATPFLLVAAFAFARSSPSLHRWLVRHPRLGPPLEQWRAHRAIGRRAKALAATTMLATFLGSWLAGLDGALLLVQAGVLAIAGLFVLSRPTPPDRRP